MTYFFSQADIERLLQFAKTQPKRKSPATKDDPFVDDGTQENFTVAQVASLWRCVEITVAPRVFGPRPGRV